MPFVDLLFGALTYPDPTTDRALRSAVALSKRMGGELTVLSVQAKLPALHHPLGNAVLQLDEMLKREESISAATAQLQKAVTQTAAEDAGVVAYNSVVTSPLYEEATAISEAARTRDILLVAITDAATFDTSLVEPLLVGSGRPLLVFPEAAEISADHGFGTAVIAWDNGPHAARAVADAMPLLRLARQVFVLVVTGDKPRADQGNALDLVRHLGAHGIAARTDYLPAQGKRADKIIRDYVASTQADLLVMGGFGHSRLREFVLGGVTNAMLRAPACPTLISH
jgi:nucleotide-binding universal stress UspA family protein